MGKKIRSIAIYLPQFHPVPENDLWWGKGFTEWTNVAAATPRFKGHYQPHIPADLGFYDLRLSEIMEQQASLAKEYGIDGFCFYHYWFDGKLILEKPLENLLKSGKPDFPYMLAWANENWTRVWDGGDKEKLLTQSYSDSDHKKHARYLIDFFKDPRYIKINGKPVFAIYKDSEIPNIEFAINIYREEAAKEGLDLYICRFDRYSGSALKNPISIGFDAAIDFQPFSKSLGDYKKEFGGRFFELPVSVIIAKIARIFAFKVFSKRLEFFSDVHVFNYSKFVDFDLRHNNLSGYKVYPCVFPSWDNSSRRKSGAVVFINGGPKKFGEWVFEKIKKFTPYSEEENLFFINAWNEWAEGNHMEPCKRYGHDFLREFYAALSRNKS